MKPEQRIVVGISGASGAIYGREFVRELLRQELQVHLIVTDDAFTVWECELGVAGSRERCDFAAWLGLDAVDPERLIVHPLRDFLAPPASGTFRHRGMVVVPCSMNTVAALAVGLAGNLLTRAADVCLKERRPLILAPRETPLNLIHLRNLTRLAEAGATIAPAMPGFYHGPQSIDDLVQHFVMKLCDLLDLPCTYQRRWMPE